MRAMVVERPNLVLERFHPLLANELSRGFEVIVGTPSTISTPAIPLTRSTCGGWPSASMVKASLGSPGLLPLSARRIAVHDDLRAVPAESHG